MGHYETISGYDDNTQTIYTYDSYLGPGQARSYAEMDIWWRHFNRAYIVLGSRWNGKPKCARSWTLCRSKLCHAGRAGYRPAGSHRESE